MARMADVANVLKQKQRPAPKKFDFKDVDADGKNGITESEWLTWVTRMDPKKTKEEVKGMFEKLDMNKDKKLDEKEFETINKQDTSGGSHSGGGSGTFALFPG